MIGKEYGKVIRMYRGNGKIRFANADGFPCPITIQQVETGLVLVSCIFTSASERVMALQHTSIDSVYGQAANGLKFETRGQVLATKWNYHTTAFSLRLALTLVAQEVALWQEVQGHASYYKFTVVNFEFIGNCPAKRIITNGTKQVYYSDLELKTPWGIAVASPVPDYETVIRRIKAQKGISVTCEVAAKPSASMELAEVTSKLDELCRLLSLARGTKINWINAEGYTEDGHLHQIILKNSVTWTFSQLAVIDTRNPEDIAVFIQKAYPAYLKLRDSYNLDVAIHLYLDAKREGAYLETRALAGVALLDILGKLQQGSENGTYLERMKGLVSKLKLPVPEPELEKVKNTRNSLVHDGRFEKSEPEKKQYFRLIGILDQVFLKLVDYDGYFIHVDIETLSFNRKKLD